VNLVRKSPVESRPRMPKQSQVDVSMQRLLNERSNVDPPPMLIISKSWKVRQSIMAL
jgi:hypothetical protein